MTVVLLDEHAVAISEGIRGLMFILCLVVPSKEVVLAGIGIVPVQ